MIYKAAANLQNKTKIFLPMILEFRYQNNLGIVRFNKATRHSASKALIPIQTTMLDQLGGSR